MNNVYRLPNMGGPTISTKLTAQLMNELRGGLFAQNERLPSEVELAEQFGVSRSVIRDVLANLEREGYVERGRGVGTVINREIVKLNNRLDLKFEYNTLIQGTGATPSVDNVKVREDTADAHIAEKLAIAPGEAVVECKKRLLASGKPVIYSIDYIPVALFNGTDWRSLDWSAPVFDIMEETRNIVVDTSITTLAAVRGTDEARQMLQVAEDEALILIHEVGNYKLSRPIIYTIGYYTNYFEFSMLRKKF